jgi:hypothetical protein
MEAVSLLPDLVTGLEGHALLIFISITLDFA